VSAASSDRRAKLLRAGNSVAEARYQASELESMLGRLEAEMDAGSWRSSLLDEAMLHVDVMRQTLLHACFCMTYITSDEE
jgi:hypothetical protein